MKLLYIKEKEENNKLKQKIKEYFNIIEITYIENKIFLTLPINEKSKNKKVIRVAKKLNKILYSECIQNVVLSTKLLESELLKNSLYLENINILDGRRLFLFLMNEAFKKICELAKIKMEETEVSILVNDNNETNIGNIIEVAKNVKRLNIITNHIEKFKKLQDYLYNDLGIMAKVSNNQKKDLLQSKIILNIDFVEELINKYKIPCKCIILNLNNEVNIETKQFNGININYYNIIMKKAYKIEKFNDEIIYESLIYNCSQKEARRRILEDEIRYKIISWQKWRN